jgi:hypothetical protein
VRQRELASPLHTRAGALAAVALVLVGVLLLSAAVPAQAQAVSIPNPVKIITGGIGTLLGGAAAAPIVGLAVKAFEAIIKALFAPLAKLVTVALVGWLTAIPNFAQGNVARLEQTMAAICGGVLGAVATLSVIRYWLAGFAGGGDSGFSALEGLVRTVGAALFIAIWPWLFEKAIGLTNLLSEAILGSGITTQEAAKLLEAGLAGTVVGSVSGIGLFLGIVVAAAASLLFLGLLLMKIVVSLSTILLFVGMPFAAVLWPVAPWIARLVGRAFLVCLAVPVLWALCFAAAAALTVDTVTLNQLTFSANGVLNTLLSPLVAIVLLYVMVRLPLHLSRVAMLGGMAVGGGFVGRAASYAAGSQMRETARQHLPEGLGGGSAEKPQQESSLSRKLRTGATAAGTAATGGTAAGAAAVGGSSTSLGGSAASTGLGSSASSATGAGTAGGSKAGISGADPRGYTPTPLAQARSSGEALQTGLREGPFHEGRFNDEMEQAQAREDGNLVTVGEARAALADLPSDTQQAVGQLASKHGEDARPYLADQATKDGWWPEERQALRTLTAATPEVRADALQEAQTDGWMTNGPIGSPSDGAGMKGSAAGPVAASGGDASVGPSDPVAGQSSDPRPVGNDAMTEGNIRSAAGGEDETPVRTPETSEAGGGDPWSAGPAGGQPKSSPDAAGGLTRPPASDGGTNAPPPRQPRDLDQHRN